MPAGQTYSFSFAAQRERLAYAAGSLEPLSVQLGEVKAICEVLFQAKVNSLDESAPRAGFGGRFEGPADRLPAGQVGDE